MDEVQHIMGTDDSRLDGSHSIASLLDSLPHAVFALDFHGTIRYANAQAAILLQSRQNELVGKQLINTLPHQLRTEFLAHTVPGERLIQPCTFDASDTRTMRWYEVSVAPTWEGVSVTFHDITARKEHADEQTRLLSVLEATPDLIGINDVRGNLIYFNRSGRNIFGIEPIDPSVTPTLGTLTAVPVVRLIEELFPIGVERGAWRGEKRILLQDGTECFMSLVVLPHFDPDGRVAYLSTIARDITQSKHLEAQLQEHIALIQEQKAELEQKQEELIRANQIIARSYSDLEAANSQLEALATTDGLTGLHNRRAFQQRLAEEYERSNRYGNPLSLMMLDVDRFKRYNDSYGHPAGDELLRHVARILASTGRSTDFVARYGGEEFVVILPDTGREGALEAAERMRLSLELEREGHEWQQADITVSIGIASYLDETSTPSRLIDEADRALYYSKDHGRNRITHYESVASLSDSRLSDSSHDQE